ncbi:Protein of unknown function [Pyronema omphalodes CBS 100304]|uniref:Uncharacterized protein n=1 Tax=Pyronema omphalodes (strain CBS 100304) TaxID=1076935 RepID=U4LA38_PYROM|nr:Protein of unknown function [Pyronema omphalodes CBS 100304]
MLLNATSILFDIETREYGSIAWPRWLWVLSNFTLWDNFVSWEAQQQQPSASTTRPAVDPQHLLHDYSRSSVDARCI